MRTDQIATAVCFTLLSVAAGNAAESTTAPKSLLFDNQTLDLAWQGGTKDAPIYDYIPTGETLDHWTHLASIREYHSLDNVKQLAENTIEMVKQSYPGAPWQSVDNPNGNETIIDFLVSAPDDSFVEYNVFKYAKREAGGIVAQQYALRAYGDDKSFLKDLSATRDRLINEMADHGLQDK
jgi:hypothetical protein